MSVFDKIIQLLDENGVGYRVLEHERVHTCEDAAKIRGTSADQGAKALVCVADGEFVLIVLPCSSKLNFKMFKKWQNVKDLRMATVDEVREVTGLEVGSIPPVGLVLGDSKGLGGHHSQTWHSMGLPLRTFVDEKLLEQEEICFNAGLHEKSVLMSLEDYVRVVKPEMGKFT